MRYWNLTIGFLPPELAQFDRPKAYVEHTDRSRNELTAIHAPWEHLDVEIIKAVLELIRKDSVPKDSTDPMVDATYNAYLSAIKSVTKVAERRGHISEHMLKLIQIELPHRTIQTEPRGRNVLLEEAQAMIDGCIFEGADDPKKQLKGLRDACIIALLFGSGPRRAELVSIDITDFNALERTIKIVGKGRKERTLKLQDQVRDYLLEYIEEAGITHGALFRSINQWGHIAQYSEELWEHLQQKHHISRPNPELLEAPADHTPKDMRDPRLTADGVYKMIKQRVLQYAPQFLATAPHDFRRGFITHLHRLGVEVTTIAELVGHRDINTTRRYIKQLDEAAREAADLISFSPKTEPENQNGQEF